MAENASTAALKSNCPIRPTARLLRSTSSGVTSGAVRHDANDANATSSTSTRDIEWDARIGLATSAYFMRHFAQTSNPSDTQDVLRIYGSAPASQHRLHRRGGLADRVLHG